MPLDDTVGGESANSYLTRAEAAEYFERRLRTSAWDDATDGDRDKALMAAAARLDQEDFYGLKVSATQAMKWPRYGAEDADGHACASDAIPQPVKDAQCELALLELENATASTALSGLASLKIGPLEITPTGEDSGDALPPRVLRLLAHVLASRPGTVRVVRG